MLVAIVPFRSPGDGKTRLGGALTPAQRGALATAMLTDVVTVIRDSHVDDLLIAARGDAAAAAARALGVDGLGDPEGSVGLDDALAAATATLGHDTDVVVVAADLPRLTTAELVGFLDLDGAVALAPTRDGGTGALLRRPHGCIPTSYGSGSADRHLGLAAAAGLRARVYHAPGFSEDVDTVEDLTALAGTTTGPATAAALTQILGVRP